MARRGTRGHEPREGGGLAYGQTSFLADELFGEASLAVSWGLTHTHTHTGIKGVSLLTYRGMYPRPGNLAVFPGNATGVLILCVNVPFDFSILIDHFYKLIRFGLKMKN